MFKFNSNLLHQSQSLICIYQQTFVHTHAFSRNLKFISNDKTLKFDGLKVKSFNFFILCSSLQYYNIKKKF